MVTSTPSYRKPTGGKLVIPGHQKQESEETYATKGIENIGREEFKVNKSSL